MSNHRLLLTTLLAAVALLSPRGARAELGGPLSSVRIDGGRLGARLSSTAMGGFTRHDLTRANGGSAHELTNADGRVFAVTWSGPGKPDLRSLLGPHFADLQATSGAPGRRLRSLRRPAQVSRPDLQIQTGGHMGWFHGVAYLPALAPAGFSVDDLPQER